MMRWQYLREYLVFFSDFIMKVYAINLQIIAPFGRIWL